MKPAFAWVGGKRQLSETIVKLMPKHNIYCEVFDGALAVFYEKPPKMAKYDLNKETGCLF